MPDKLPNDIGDAEMAMVNSSDADIPTLRLADLWTRETFYTLSLAPIPGYDDDDEEALQALAVVYVAVLGVRSMRSLMLLCRFGYEVEALVNLRRLTECKERSKLFLKPMTGPEECRRWLKTQHFQAAKKLFVGKGRAWDLFGNASHADARAILHLRAPAGPGKYTLHGFPRRTQVVNETIDLATGVLRDLCLSVAHVLPEDVDYQWNDELDTALQEQRDQLR